VKNQNKPPRPKEQGIKPQGIKQFTELVEKNNAVTKDPLTSPDEKNKAVSSSNIIDNISSTPGVNIYTKEFEKFANVVNSIREILKPIYVKALSTILSYSQNIAEIKYEQFLYKQSILILWNEFEEELKSKNRYHPKSKFLTIFNKFTRDTRYLLPKGTVYIEQENFQKIVLLQKLRNYLTLL